MNGFQYGNGAYDASGMSQDGQPDMGEMMMMGQDGMAGNMSGGQSLDDIVNQNSKMVRRTSMPQQQQQMGQSQYGNYEGGSMRRVSSMMEFNGGSSTSPMTGYPFEPNLGIGQSMNQNGGMSGGVTPTQASQMRNQSRRQSGGELALNTGFSQTPQSYAAMMAATHSAYASPAHPSSVLDVDMNSPFMDSSLGMGMDYNLDQTGMNNPTGNGVDSMQMNMYAQPQFSQQMATSSPMHSGMPQSMSGQQRGHSSQDPGGGGGGGGGSTAGSARGGNTPSTHREVSRSHSMHQASSASPHPQQSKTPGSTSYGQSQGQNQGQNRSQSQSQSQSQDRGHNNQQGYQQGRGSQQYNMNAISRHLEDPRHQQNYQEERQHNNQHGGPGGGFKGQLQNPQPGSKQDRGMGNVTDGLNGPLPGDSRNYNPNNQGFKWEPMEGGWPSTMVGRPHMQSAYKNAYSSTGFDMLGVLMRVATRPNPEINIGSVDLSCAFVVCDAELDDFPIVYCSDNFERLTGYTKHMILGRNCRFLQSPDGNVAAGVRRKYVDDDSVLYLKNMINLRRESQISLINYRRGGQPFMNLLTMIPITWDTDQVKFFVGFQVDLVEQPNAVTNKNPDGSYSINYQRGMTMPPYVMNAPESTTRPDIGQTVPRDDVSTILSTIGSGESEYAKRMWDKVLLENTDDVVHVLSLKGLFQWVSPSALKVLEYEASELIGTALSSVCHPSDIVPVTRELKDTSSGASVNVVFRIRRKKSGYMWFEGHGSLHTEQGKGRKSIIMVGRERPVYTLDKKEIVSAGGVGENELWTKMSTSGMFLFVSSSVRQLLDRQPEELIGVSIQSLMRSESKGEFGRILEHARTGRKASVKHEMINRRGQVLSAFTTLYPGDANEGAKPTFIVAQTRLVKFSRGAQATRPSMYTKADRPSSNESAQTRSSIMTESKQHLIAPAGSEGDRTPLSGLSGKYVNTDGNAVTYSGQNGLLIGRQDHSLASEDNLFDELKTTKSSSWQYEIRQLEKRNRTLAEEVQNLIASKKKRKRRKGAGNQQKDCANCHTRVTPEWRRGPSGQRDLCNSCGLRWAKLNGRVSPRASSQHSAGASDKASKASASPRTMHGAGGVGAIKNESPLHASMSNLPETENPVAESPKVAKGNESSSHAANMEGASGVPDKIDEGVEAD